MSESGFLGSGIGPQAIRNQKNVASWTVTTTGAATHTIAAFTVSASTVIDWGDGSTSTYTGSGARTHDYAGAGTWTVRVMQPLNVTALTLSNNEVTLNSADIKSMINMVAFQANGLKAGTFNSSDVSAWRPTTFRLYDMPSGYAGTFNSADVSAWRPTTFALYTMPAGYAGTFNSVDVSAWRPTTFYLYSMPSGYAGTFNSVDVSAWRPTTFAMHSMPAGYAVTAGGGFAGWTTTTTFYIQSNALSQATVNAIIYELYQASAAPRTASGGTINVAGTNAAPSGTFQAVASPPVSASTPGKEIAYELLNDSLGLFNNWATVTITA